MTYAELPVTGYLDRFSHRPGETFTAFVSLHEGSAYRARLLRVVSGDPNPAGPRMQLEDLSERFDRRIEGHRQPIALGSCGIVDRGPAGGAVFSVGSITFCGSLWRDGFEGPVSQLLDNVVRRFGTP